MTNFVLTGAPDFVVVGLPWQPSLPQPGGAPAHVNPDFADVLCLLGAGGDARPLGDAVDHTEASRAALQRVLDRFGFERHPLTYAELHGLFDYCDRLTALSGVGVLPPAELAAWQARSFLLLSRRQAPLLAAARMYGLGDVEGLRAWHRDPDALLQLGRAYRRLP
jgi:hypothetical protein